MFSHACFRWPRTGSRQSNYSDVCRMDILHHFDPKKKGPKQQSTDTWYIHVGRYPTVHEGRPRPAVQVQKAADRVSSLPYVQRYIFTSTTSCFCKITQAPDHGSNGSRRNKQFFTWVFCFPAGQLRPTGTKRGISFFFPPSLLRVGLAVWEKGSLGVFFT